VSLAENLRERTEEKKGEGVGKGGERAGGGKMSANRIKKGCRIKKKTKGCNAPGACWRGKNPTACHRFDRASPLD